ncbi:hypothetical protein FN846DRAFT_947549, partial [Sphaerosporella brunnea]
METPRRRRPIHPPIPETPFDDDDIAEADIICRGEEEEELQHPSTKKRIVQKAERYVRGHEALYIHSVTLRGPVVTNPWARKVLCSKQDSKQEEEEDADVKDVAITSGKGLPGKNPTREDATTRITSFYSAHKGNMGGEATIATAKLNHRAKNDDDFTMGDTRGGRAWSPAGVEVSVRWVSRRGKEPSPISDKTEVYVYSPEQIREAETMLVGSPSGRSAASRRKKEWQPSTPDADVPPADKEEGILDTITLSQPPPPPPPQAAPSEPKVLDTITVATPAAPAIIHKKTRRQKINFDEISPAVGNERVRPPKKKRKKTRRSDPVPGKDVVVKLSAESTAGNVMKETTANVQTTDGAESSCTFVRGPKEVENVMPGKCADNLKNMTPAENLDVRVQACEETTKPPAKNDPKPQLNLTNSKIDTAPSKDLRNAQNENTNMVPVPSKRPETIQNYYGLVGKQVPKTPVMMKSIPEKIVSNLLDGIVEPKETEPVEVPAEGAGPMDLDEIEVPNNATEAPPSSPPYEVTPWKGTQVQLTAAQTGFFNAMAKSPIYFNTFQTPAADSANRPAAQTQTPTRRQSSLWEEWPVPFSSPGLPNALPSPPPPPPAPASSFSSEHAFPGRHLQLTPFSAFYTPSPSKASRSEVQPSSELPSSRRLRFANDDRSSSPPIPDNRFAAGAGMGQQGRDVVFPPQPPSSSSAGSEPPRQSPCHESSPSSSSSSSSAAKQKSGELVEAEEGIQYMLSITQPWDLDEEIKKMSAAAVAAAPASSSSQALGIGRKKPRGWL